MDYVDVFTVAVGLLAVLRIALFMIYGVAFSEDRAAHPIYKERKDILLTANEGEISGNISSTNVAEIGRSKQH